MMSTLYWYQSAHSGKQTRLLCKLQLCILHPPHCVLYVHAYGTAMMLDLAAEQWCLIILHILTGSTESQTGKYYEKEQ